MKFDHGGKFSFMQPYSKKHNSHCRRLYDMILFAIERPYQKFHNVQIKITFGNLSKKLCNFENGKNKLFLYLEIFHFMMDENDL